MTSCPNPNSPQEKEKSLPLVNNLPKAKGNSWSYFIIILVAAISLGLAVYADGPTKLIATLKEAKVLYLLIGAACMLLYWYGESIVLHLTAKKSFPQQRFTASVVTSMIGQLFNCITPFASGGQPIQAYYLVRKGMPVGIATSTLLAKFIVYQTVLTLYSLVVLLGSFAKFSARVEHFSKLVLVGFVINCVVVSMLVAVGFFPVFTNRFLVGGANFFAKLGLIKDIDALIETIGIETSNFHTSFTELRSHTQLLMQMSLITALQLTMFFSVPYFVCLALGVSEITYFDMVAASAFILMITSFVPLPGASGGAEGSFYLFFHMFFPTSGAISVAILLWRMLTFYLPIAAGTLFARSLTSDER